MVDSNPHFAMLCQNPFSSEKHKSVEAFNNGFVNDYCQTKIVFMST